MQTILKNLKVVVIDCPYNTLAREPRTAELFGKYVSFKLRGFLEEYPHGVLPLSSYDFIANLVFLCEDRAGQLNPVMGFKSVTLDRSDYFGLPFELLQLVPEATLPEHRAAIQGILAEAVRRNRTIGYNSSWTISPNWRQSPEHKQLARDLTVSLFTQYYRGHGIDEILIAGATRFKVEKLQAYAGFKNLELHGKELPIMECSFAFGEKTQIMHLTQFSVAAIEAAERYESLWKERIILADPTQFRDLNRRAA